jgi:hypothetical protein
MVETFSPGDVAFGKACGEIVIIHLSATLPVFKFCLPVEFCELCSSRTWDECTREFEGPNPSRCGVFHLQASSTLPFGQFSLLWLLRCCLFDTGALASFNQKTSMFKYSFHFSAGASNLSFFLYPRADYICQCIVMPTPPNVHLYSTRRSSESTQIDKYFQSGRILIREFLSRMSVGTDCTLFPLFATCCRRFRLHTCRVGRYVIVKIQ